MRTLQKPLADAQRQLLNRMSYIRGHVEAVRKMIDAGAYCPDVILQNLAVVKALKRVNELILAQHLRSCARKAMRGNDAKAQARVEREIISIVRNSC
ncbi:MAG: metal-sensing transcriptional repressor [bacterium]|nr:metal-sensing transcriptional repressor [bacterium]